MRSVRFRLASPGWAVIAATVVAACATSAAPPVATSVPAASFPLSRCTVDGPLKGKRPTLRVHGTSANEPLLVVVERQEDGRTIEVFRQTGNGAVLIDLTRALALAHVSVSVFQSVPCQGECNPPTGPHPPPKLPNGAPPLATLRSETVQELPCQIEDSP